MNVDHKKGGRIINSRGQEDAAAWAQPAEWVDYQGPVAGENVGIAIFAHPESLNYPAPWHVRTYGLFAGNPLGKVAFTNDAGDVRKREPSLKLPKDGNSCCTTASSCIAVTACADRDVAAPFIALTLRRTVDGSQPSSRAMAVGN